MFSWLFGKRPPMAPRDDDQIWRDLPSKLAGIAAAIANTDPQATRTLVIAHFPASFRALEHSLQAHGLQPQSISSADSARLLEQRTYAPPGTLLLTMASLLPERGPLSPATSLPSPFGITVLVAEHHPLHSNDQAILRWACQLPAPARVVFHESLDSALMRRFNGESVTRLLDRLQTDSSTPVSSSLIARAIVTAQERIAKRVHSAVPANSAEQWFEINFGASSVE